MPEDDPSSSFFVKERDRLSEEVANGFEVLLSSVNVLNRKVEEVLGMTGEYESIASLWDTFHQLMRQHSTEADVSLTQDQSVVTPGAEAGGHVA